MLDRGSFRPVMTSKYTAFDLVTSDGKLFFHSFFDEAEKISLNEYCGLLGHKVTPFSKVHNAFNA